MRISPPSRALYACSFDEACDIKDRRSLNSCDPAAYPVCELSFQNDADAIHFALGFRQAVSIEENVAIISPSLQAKVDEFLVETGIEQRVVRRELLGMEFWDTDDEAAFDEELGITQL